MSLSRFLRTIRSKKLLWVLAGLVLLGGAELRRRLQRAALVREFEATGAIVYRASPDGAVYLPTSARDHVWSISSRYGSVESFEVRCDKTPAALFGRVLDDYPSVQTVYLEGPASSHLLQLIKLEQLADLEVQASQLEPRATLEWIEPLSRLKRLRVVWSAATAPSLDCDRWGCASSLETLDFRIDFHNDYNDEVERKPDYFSKLPHLKMLKSLKLHAESDVLCSSHLKFLRSMPQLEDVVIWACDFCDEEQIQPLIPAGCNLHIIVRRRYQEYADAPDLLQLVLICVEDPNGLKSFLDDYDLADQLNQERYQERSALHWMAHLWKNGDSSKTGLLEVTRTLLDEGASPDVRDSEGVSVAERFASIPELNALLATPDASPAKVPPGNSE